MYTHMPDILKTSLFFRRGKIERRGEEVPFLGFIPSSTSVRADPKKLCFVEYFPTPRNKKELHAFLDVLATTDVLANATRISSNHSGNCLVVIHREDGTVTTEQFRL